MVPKDSFFFLYWRSGNIVQHLAETRYISSLRVYLLLLSELGHRVAKSEITTYSISHIPTAHLMLPLKKGELFIRTLLFFFFNVAFLFLYLAVLPNIALKKSIFPSFRKSRCVATLLATSGSSIAQNLIFFLNITYVLRFLLLRLPVEVSEMLPPVIWYDNFYIIGNLVLCILCYLFVPAVYGCTVLPYIVIYIRSVANNK